MKVERINCCSPPTKLQESFVLLTGKKKKKKNFGSKGPDVTEVSVRTRSPPQGAPHTGSSIGNYSAKCP
jgi:hypothetical protein